MRPLTSLSGPAPTLRYYVVLLVTLFSFFESTLAATIVLQTALMPGFPNVTQCAVNFELLWKGGASPWSVTITAASPDEIIEKGTVDLQSFPWKSISLPVGSTGQITITDSNQEQTTSPYTIVSNPKGNNLCRVFTPLTPPTTSTTSSSGPSATDTTSRSTKMAQPAGLNPGSATFSSSGAAPVQSSIQVSPSQNTQPSDSSRGATTGIVIGVVTFFFALGCFVVVYCLRRRNRRRRIHHLEETHQHASREEPDLHRRVSLGSFSLGTAEHSLSTGGSPLKPAQPPRTSSLAVGLSQSDAESLLTSPPARQSRAPPLPWNTSNTTCPEKTAGDSEPVSAVQASPTFPLSTAQSPPSAPDRPSPPDAALLRATILDVLRSLSSGQRQRLINVDELDIPGTRRQSRVEVDRRIQLSEQPVLSGGGGTSDDAHGRIASYASTLPPPYSSEPPHVASATVE